VEAAAPEERKAQADSKQANIQLKARLNNFQIWVPLEATNTDTQIFNLSFVSDLNYQKAVGLPGQQSFDYMNFQVN
jgi:hypothetical protein